MPILPANPSDAAPWYMSRGKAGELYASLERLPQLGRAINTNARALRALARKPGVTEDADFQRAVRDHASAVQGYLDALETVDEAVTLAVSRGYIDQAAARRGMTYTEAPTDGAGLGAWDVAFVPLLACSPSLIAAVGMVLFSVGTPLLLAIVLVSIPIIAVLALVALNIEKTGEAVVRLGARYPGGAPSPLEQIGSTFKWPLILLAVGGGLLLFGRKRRGNK